MRRWWILVVGLLLLGFPAEAAVAHGRGNAEGGGTAEVTVRVLPPKSPGKPPGKLPETGWGGVSPVPVALGGIALIVLGVVLVRQASRP